MNSSVVSFSLSARLWTFVNRSLLEQLHRSHSLKEIAPALRAMTWSIAAALAFVFTASAEAAPVVTAVTPGSGPPSGGTVVTLAGTDFVFGATVSFGATAATNVTLVSATSITATSPAGAPGPINVTVTTADGTSATSAGNAFYYGTPGTLEIISAKDRARPDAPGTGENSVSSTAPAVSADGRYVAFLSVATDLVLDQSSSSSNAQVFLRDRTNNTTRLLSGTGGSATTANGTNGAVSISADGLSVVFISTATDLVSPATTGTQVFHYRRGSEGTGSVTLVSHTASSLTTSCNSSSSSPMISRDGSTIVFLSTGTDLVSPYSTGTLTQGFRYDVATGAITLATPRNGTVTSAQGITGTPTLRAISDDGLWIGFASTSTNALSTATTSGNKFFLFDSVNGTTRLLNRQIGTLATNANGISGNGGGISSDGHYVTFLSAATNLISGQSGTGNQIYLYNRVADTITLISRSVSDPTAGANSPSTFANTTFGLPVISSDGRFVVFGSAATDVVSDYVAGGPGVQYYLYDGLGNSGSGSVTLITHTTDSATTGSAGGISLNSASIGSNGSRVVFATAANDLVAGVTDNFISNVYAYTTATGVLTFVSGTAVDSGSVSTTGGSYSPVVSGDGTFIAFRSFASDLAADDTNGTSGDLFGYTEFQVGVPTVTSGNSVTYTEAGSAAPVDSNLTISNSGSSTLASAMVSISAGFSTGDTLDFVGQNGITASYNSATGVLTLTGSATRASYQAALRSITFNSTSHDPTNSGANPSRTITWVVNDGTTDSSPVTSTVNITAVNDVPTFVGATTALNLSQDASATSIVSILHASDPDGSQTLTWSQNSAPSHGTLSFSNATASTPGTDITPGGTITYTPSIGYTGSDSFIVQVGDGTAVATRTIAVTISAPSPFTYTTDSGSITITGYTSIPLDGVVVIPDTIDGYPVTSIGPNAFNGCSLTSVTISDSVTTIGSGAFGDCANLASVVFGSGVTTIGTFAFDICSSLTSVTIGNGVTTIGNYAFNECWGLSSVTIPDSVTSIGFRAFFRCTGLTNVMMGNGVATIGINGFYGCTNLAGVYFGGNAPSPDNDLSVFSGATNGIVYHLVAATGWGALFDGLPTMVGTPPPPNTAPTDIALSNSSVNASAGADAVVGTLTTTDVDSGDSHTYTLVSGTGDTDNTSFNLSGSSLRANNTGSLTAGSHSVRIATNDGHGGAYAKAFTITVVDDVAPTVVSITRQTPSAQALVANTVVFEVTFSEDLSAIDASSFVVSRVNNSSVTAVIASVSGGPRVYTVTVNLTSGTGDFRLDGIAAPPIASEYAAGLVYGLSMAFDRSGDLFVTNNGVNRVSKVTTDGTVSTFATGLPSPEALAFDSSGLLYVACPGNNLINKVAANGTVTTFASGFAAPVGLAFDGADNLYVSNLGSGSVKRVTPQGVVSNFASGFSSPWGLAFDSAGNLFVADTGNGTVRKVTPDGSVSIFATGFSSPMGLTFDREGNLYVANNNSGAISKVTSDGAVSTLIGGLTSPSALAFDSAGTLYVLEYADTGRVLKLTPAPVTDLSGNKLASLPFVSGEVYSRVKPAITSITRQTPLSEIRDTGIAVFEVTFSLDVTGVETARFAVTPINGGTTTGTVTSVTGGPSVYEVTVHLTSGSGDFRLDSVVSPIVTAFAAGFDGPSALAFDGTGNLYVANNNSGEISKVASDGSASVFANGFTSPTGLAFDSQGNLYVANNGNAVSKVTSDGFESPFASNLAGPIGLAVDGQDNLYVSTRWNDSVAKVTTSGVVSDFASDFNGPAALAFSAAGDLYVANQWTDSVSKVTSGGRRSFFADGFGGGAGLAFDRFGNLFVANNWNDTVSQVAGDGTVSTLQLMISQPTGLAFDSAGRLYVASQADGTVIRLTILPPMADLTGLEVSGLAYASGETVAYDPLYPPTDITLSTSTVGQSGGANATVGTLTTTDANSGDSHTYSLVSGAGATDNASFNLSGAAVIANNSAALAVGSYSIRIETNDGNGGTYAKAFTIVVVDDIVPVVTSVDVPANAPYGAGRNLDFIVHFTKNITVNTAGGTPHIALNFENGGTVYATYVSGSGTGSLTFRYTVGSGTFDPNGIMVGALDLNGSTLRDAVGNNATLTLNSVGSTTGVLVDAVAPQITSILRETPSAQVVRTNSVVFAVTFSEATANVHAGLFAVTPINGGTTTGTVTSVTGGPSAYEVTVVIVSGAGDFRLDVLAPSTTATTFATGVSSPIGLAIDRAGNVYAANNNTASVSKMSSDGTVARFALGFGGPQALTFDTAGNLYVAHGSPGGVVAKVEPTGTTSTFATGFNPSRGLAFDAAGNLYVSNFSGNSVSKVTPGGAVSTFATGFNHPSGLAFDAAGNLYVANFSGNTVLKVTSGGVVSTFATGFNMPDGLAFDSAGNLYVANFMGGSLSKVTPGGVVSGFAVGFDLPAGLAFDESGNLYVANFGADTVSRLALGTMVDLSGNPVSGLPYTSGENYTYALNEAPTDIALSRSSVNQSDGANAILGTLTTTDANSGDSHTYTLVSGAGDTDNGSFTLSSATLLANNAAALAPGSYSVRLRTDDGHDGYFEKTFALTVVDDVAPATPSTPDLTAASDTGSSNTDNITGVATPTFTGTAEANSTVQLFRGGSTLLGTTTADGSGNWTLTVGSALGAGTYSITAKAMDVANNVSDASPPLSVTIVGTAPAAPSVPDLTATSDTGSSNTDNITSVTTPTFTGTAEANSTVQLFRDGSTLLGTATADENGAWSIIVGTPLDEGVYSITAKAGDAAGQTSAASAALTLTIDTTASAAPVVTAISEDTGVSSSDHITSDTTLILSGSAAANETVTLFRNTAQIGTSTANSSGIWSFDYTGTTLASGTHTFTAESTDLAGNVSEESAVFLVEINVSTPSAPVITAIANDTGTNEMDGITSDAALVLSGTADAGSTVTISQSLVGVIGSAAANGAGVWSFDYSGTTLPDGDYLFTAFARNTVGNTSAVSADFPVRVDITAPTITTQPVGGIHGPADAFTLDVTAFDSNLLSYQWYRGASALSDNSDWSGSTSASLRHVVGGNGLAGDYTVHITDVAGNSITSQTATVVLGGADQTITFSPVGSITVGTSLILDATASSGLPVTFLVVSGNATISGASFTANDANSTTVRATQAGNASYHAVTADQIISTISKLPQAITFAALADRLTDAPTFSLGASATSSLPVIFAMVSGPATVSGNSLTLTGLPGTVTVIARQSGNAVYSAAPDATRSFNVTSNYPVSDSDGFAGSATGAGAGAQRIAVATAAEFRTHVVSPVASIITIVGTLNLGAAVVEVQSNKTIQGLDDHATLVGNLHVASNVTNVVIRGLILTNPGATLVSGVQQETVRALSFGVSSAPVVSAAAATTDGAAVTISGARNIFITHCSFFDCADYAVKITDGADNISISWSEFGYTSGQGSHRASVLIGNAGTEAAPLHVSLHHNVWSAGVDQGMPVANYAYVHLYNNYFNTPGNTTGTEALDQSQVLSERNVYEGVNNPLMRRQVNSGLPIGRILAIGNLYTGTTGTLPYAGTDAVFTPSYSYEVLPVSDVVAVLLAHAGNTSGANETGTGVGSATLNGPAAPVIPGASFTLNVTAKDATPSTYQWRRNNLDIPGATAASYGVANMQEINAGTYTVALGLSSDDMVVSTPLIVALGAAPVVVPPPTTPSSSSGGGGAISSWLVGSLALLSLLRIRHLGLKKGGVRLDSVQQH